MPSRVNSISSTISNGCGCRTGEIRSNKLCVLSSKPKSYGRLSPNSKTSPGVLDTKRERPSPVNAADVRLAYLGGIDVLIEVGVGVMYSRYKPNSVLPFPAASCATPAGIDNVKLPSEEPRKTSKL